MVDRNTGLAGRFDKLSLSDRVGLLYPDSDAVELTELHESHRPDQLVILDGTWHQAKTLMRDIPRLSELKRYRLAPSTPGEYRIRREPNLHALSTIEATVAALRSLEPSTAGLDDLLAVFHQMVSGQLAHPKSQWRKNERRRKGMPNIPRALIGDLRNIVVAYGDQERIDRPDVAASESATPRPVYWTAKRMISGETFHCAIEGPSLQDQQFLEILQLGCEDIAQPKSMGMFRQGWKDFLRPEDQVAVYHRGTANLLVNSDAEFCPVILLNSISIDADLQRGTLADFLATQGIISQPIGKSRASKRLADAVAYVEFLNRKYKR